MYLQRLKLIQFKNYLSKEFSFGGKFNCLSGQNGMGKTNVLEAIYYLCLTKSCQGLSDKQLVTYGKDFFRIEGDFEQEAVPPEDRPVVQLQASEHEGSDLQNIAADVEEAYGSMPYARLLREGKCETRKSAVVAKVIPGKRKEFEVNGLIYERLAEHIGLLPVVFIAPDDNLLVMEGSEGRRRFLDLTLSQLDTSYLFKLMKYNKLLRQRNASLKQFAQEGTFNQSLIAAYDGPMSELGDWLYARRREFMEAFLPWFQKYHGLIAGREEPVECIYRSPLEKGTMAALLKKQLERDRMLQRTEAGVHRDDLLFSMGGHPLKKYGSQGQIKTFVLALKLAQYRLLSEQKGKKPILLLDDLFDKLDNGRVLSLLQLLNGEDFGQVFITHTEGEALEELFEQGGLGVPVHYKI